MSGENNYTSSFFFFFVVYTCYNKTKYYVQILVILISSSEEQEKHLHILNAHSNYVIFARYNTELNTVTNKKSLFLISNSSV